ncbi:MAG: hypothetical protein WD669_06055 [Pirellulales bacterium]
MTPELAVQSELLSYLGQLAPSDQARVVEFARTLTGAPKSPIRGVPGRELLRIVGTIPHDDLERMKKAIEEECERVDANEW